MRETVLMSKATRRADWRLAHLIFLACQIGCGKAAARHCPFMADFTHSSATVSVHPKSNISYGGM
jgi:hypothetical protein